MAKTSNIAWTKSTFNPWLGCTKVSPGCDHCYASVSTPARTMKIEWGPGKPRHRTSAANWRQPLRWNERAEKTGERWEVFCSSLSDPFDNEVPDAWRRDLWDLIEWTPRLTWLLLTKRISNVIRMTRTIDWLVAHKNVWLGVTVVNQAEADRDIPKLLATPAAKRFVSYEPALGPVDWKDYWLIPSPSAAFQEGRVTPDMPDWTRIGAYALDWIIVGGESDQPGMKARPFDIAWARSTVEQCKAAGVPVFVKQLGSNVRAPRSDAIQLAMAGSWRADAPGAPYGVAKPADRAGADPAEWPADLRVREFP